MKKVLLGFSGGIDSIESANTLIAQGFDVVACTLDMYNDPELIDKASCRAKEIGVDFISLDVSREFDAEIRSYFVSQYMQGRTPAPCTLCNTRIKWRFLAQMADKLGIHNVATGHYFRIAEFNGKRYVARPSDRHKDQTYYLWGLDQQILGRIITPMANVFKSDVLRKNSDKTLLRESMGVCFLKGRSCKEFLQDVAGDVSSGFVVDKSGNIVGSHDGYPYYTIGQKRGLDTSVHGCVIDINPGTNVLTLGEDKDLYHSHLRVGSHNVADMDELIGSSDVSVMIRGIGCNPSGFCRIKESEGSLLVELDEPAWAAAKGQPVVFYRGDRVVGGGILENYY